MWTTRPGAADPRRCTTSAAQPVASPTALLPCMRAAWAELEREIYGVCFTCQTRSPGDQCLCPAAATGPGPAAAIVRRSDGMMLMRERAGVNHDCPVAAAPAPVPQAATYHQASDAARQRPCHGSPAPRGPRRRSRRGRQQRAARWDTTHRLCNRCSSRAPVAYSAPPRPGGRSVHDEPKRAASPSLSPSPITSHRLPGRAPRRGRQSLWLPCVPPPVGARCKWKPRSRLDVVWTTHRSRAFGCGRLG